MEKTLPAHELVLLNTYDPGYLRIVEQICRGALAAGHIPVVANLTQISPVPVDTFDRRVLRLFGLKAPGWNAAERFRRLGAQYETYSPGSEVRLSAGEADALEIAIESALITYYRTEAPDHGRFRVAKLAARLRQEGERTYGFVTGLLNQRTFAKVYLPNGRFPSQKMATLAARAVGVETWHFEKGESPNSAYLQAYSPQDRLGSQGAVDQVLMGISASAIDAVADQWLAKRGPAPDSRNEFSAGWQAGVPVTIASRDANTKVVGFFTSSQDEFQFLGPEWQLHTWDSQFQAFDTLLTAFESQGYLCYLRVHPNLATKAHDCFKREREGSRALARKHPNLIVIWHDDPTSTYSLLEQTDAAVVWDSTVGLEASARGISVWTCAASRYGLVADVREALGPENVSAELLTPWQVSTHAAKSFIAYLVKRDLMMPAEYDSWLSWPPGQRGLGVKLSALTVSGGNPTVFDALLFTFDTWRHRSLRANLRRLRSR